MCIGRVIVGAAVVAAGAIVVRAQDGPRIEVAVETGYTVSEGIKASQSRVIAGQVYNDLDIKSGANLGLTFGVFVTPNAEVEFLWNRQFSKFEAGNPAPSVELADVSVDNFHGNFVYNWFDGAAKLRPFLFAGLGATHYAPGDPAPLGGSSPTVVAIDSATKFSWSLGGGVKAYPAQHVGLRLTARWTPTYIKSDSAGIWCDPFFPTCWVLADPDYSNQFALTGGVTLRF
jgi:opacity protein-like surface antigen